MKIKYLFLSLFHLITVSSAYSQKKDIEIMKVETGNVITYYAKNHLRDFLTVEVSIEGSGFTPSVTLPATVDLKSFEKKELVKITLDAGGGSTYSISYKYYKTGSKPANTTVTNTKSVIERPELKRGIVLFSKDDCGKCTYAKNYLSEKFLPFTEINISKNDEDSNYFWKVLKDAGFNGTSVQTPVIMVDGKVHYDMDIKSFLAGLK